MTPEARKSWDDFVEAYDKMDELMDIDPTLWGGPKEEWRACVEERVRAWETLREKWRRYVTTHEHNIWREKENGRAGEV